MKDTTEHTIGPYRVSGVLGKGGMGIVYKAVSISSGEIVALKVLKRIDTSFSDEDARLRFTDEATASARVHSQWLVKYIDSGVDPVEGSYIAYELLKGPSLDLFLKGRGSMSAGQVLSLIGKPLLLGLQDMHAQGILHRDIKPDNMLRVDDNGIFKLCDLGIARFSERAAKTKTGMIVGTPQYIAPERFSPLLATGDEKATDIFSAAVLLTHCLTGEEPGSILHKDRKWSPSLTEVTPEALVDLGLSSSVATVLSKALSFDMSLRPQTCSQFYEELREAIEKEESPRTGFQKTQLSSVNSIRKQMKRSSGAAVKNGLSESSQGKNSRKKRLRIAFTAFMFLCLIVIFWAVAGTSFLFKPRKQTDLSFEDLTGTSLFNLAAACNVEIPSFVDFRRFLDEEESLFSKAVKTRNDLSTHNQKLLYLITHGEKKLFFHSFLEYLYRFRCGSKGALQLLEKSNDILWESILASKSSTGEDVEVAHILFFTLWKDLRSDPLRGQDLVNRLMNAYLSLPYDVRATLHCRAFCHTLAICGVYLTDMEGLKSDSNMIDLLASMDRVTSIFSVPRDREFLFKIPPYENTILSERFDRLLPEDVTARYTIVKISTEEFETQCRIVLEKTWKIIDLVSQKRDALKTQLITPSAVDLSPQGISDVPDVGQEVDRMIAEYAANVNFARLMFSFAPNTKEWALFLIRAAGNLMRFTVYRLNNDVGTNPSGHPLMDFVDTYSACGMDAATFLYQDTRLSTAGYVTISLTDILDQLLSFKQSTFPENVGNFIASTESTSFIYATSLRVRVYRACVEQKPSLEQLEVSFNALIAEARKMDKEDFEGWSVLTAIISNELFIEYKKRGKTVERADKTNALIKVLSENYIHGKFPENCRLFPFYALAERLRKATIIHWCDAYLSLGTNIEDAFPDEYKKIGVGQAFDEMIAGNVQKGAVAVDKLKRRVIVEVDDILINPLDY